MIYWKTNLQYLENNHYKASAIEDKQKEICVFRIDYMESEGLYPNFSKVNGSAVTVFKD